MNYINSAESAKDMFREGPETKDQVLMFGIIDALLAIATELKRANDLREQEAELEVTYKLWNMP